MSDVHSRVAWIAVGLVALVVAYAAAVAAEGGVAQPFRPSPIKPVIRPALRGEGVWHAVGPLIQGGPPVLTATFRPDRGNPSVIAYVAWVDLTRTQLALYPGTSQPPLAVPRGPSEIPRGQRWRLLATFNGGFKYGSGSGGGGGFSVNGHTYVPLERGLGTLVAYRNGRVNIIAWPAGRAAGARVAFARQNLHLLVNAGRPAANLSSQAIWGWVFGLVEPTWRTGVGIDQHGNLIYAAADDTNAGLAGILIRAGAVRAIELDMNGLWPTFNVYRHSHGLHPAQFVPNYLQSVDRYLTPDSRDFFAIYRRVNGPASVPPTGRQTALLVQWVAPCIRGWEPGVWVATGLPCKLAGLPLMVVRVRLTASSPRA